MNINKTLMKITMVGLFAFGVSACSVYKGNVQDVSGKNISMKYLDSNVFDEKLGSLFNGGAESIKIQVVGNITLNSIPKRLSNWIEESTENGAKLKITDARDVVVTRGYTQQAVVAIYQYFNNYSRNSQYKDSGKYDIEMIYENNSAKIKSIKYTKRKNKALLE